MMIFFKGFGLGLGLIAAIGAQNAFVLSQGIKREYYLLIPFICFLCDGILISIGFLGVGKFLSSTPLLFNIATIGGVLFLFIYGLKSFVSAFSNNKIANDSRSFYSTSGVVKTTLAITLLNPHVYLDTVLFLGSVSISYAGYDKLFFGLGTISASFMWFFSLSLGGKILSPMFHKAVSWKILDVFVGCIMWFIAIGLIAEIIS